MERAQLLLSDQLGLRLRGAPLSTSPVRWLAAAVPDPAAALLVLAHLRCGDTCARRAAGFRIGIVTVYR
ncbi:hypothetical protein [Streptomyces sp. Qhu-G9]|uniref:hypothetical protein n=1 Tax=Streptomyces sp. Qhu-G9 TaxID=3452799 RepID=UPI003AF5578C